MTNLEKQFKTAESKLNPSFFTWDKEGSRRQGIELMEKIASKYLLDADYSVAGPLYIKCAETAQILADYNLSLKLYNQAIICLKNAKLDTKGCYEQIIKIANITNDTGQLAKTYYQLGLLFYGQDKAIDYFLTAAKYFAYSQVTLLDHIRSNVIAANHMVKREEKGDISKAIKLYEVAFDTTVDISLLKTNAHDYLVRALICQVYLNVKNLLSDKDFDKICSRYCDLCPWLSTSVVYDCLVKMAKGDDSDKTLNRLNNNCKVEWPFKDLLKLLIKVDKEPLLQ